MDGRDGLGRFVAGSAGGPGRPRRAAEAEYLTTLQENVSQSDWAAIVQRAVQEAKRGDAKARGWLGTYLLPKTDEDAGELQRPTIEMIERMMSQIPIDPDYAAWLDERAMAELKRQADTGQGDNGRPAS